MLFTVNPVLSNKCKDMKGFLSNSTVLMASICAVGNPLLSPQDASSPSLLSPTPFILSCVPSTDQSIKRFLSSLFWLLLPQFYTNSSSSNLRVETQAVNFVFSLHYCSGIFTGRFACTPVFSDLFLIIPVLKLHGKVFDSRQLTIKNGDSSWYIVGLRSWDISHKIALLAVPHQRQWFFFVAHQHQKALTSHMCHFVSSSFLFCCGSADLNSQSQQITCVKLWCISFCHVINKMIILFKA